MVQVVAGSSPVAHPSCGDAVARVTLHPMPEPLIIHLRTGDELRVEADREELSSAIAGRPFVEIESSGRLITVFSSHVVWLEPIREGGGRG